MPLPDFVAQEWEKVQPLLINYDLKKEITAPPWSGVGQGKLRVVRQRVRAEKQLELVLAYEEYLKVK